MKIIKEVTKNDLLEFLYDLPIEDKKLYEEMNNKDSLGIFQMNGGTAQKMVDLIQPSDFTELTAVNSFARPGTSDFAPQYVKNRKSKSSPYPKQVAALLQETNSIILYQEQVMEIFHKIGGFTLAETDEVRGLMKKLSKAEKKQEDLDRWDEVIERFEKNAIDKGIQKSNAKNLANDMLKMSSYSFNKSHATAYTYIAAMTLYLSVYFRKYFYSSVLAYEVDRDKYLLDRLKSIKRRGFIISPPNINKSKKHISPLNDNEIIFGLNEIKYVGEKPSEIIIANRPYDSLIDFIIKTRDRTVNIRLIKALISTGAFDEIEKERGRKRLLKIVEAFWEKKKSIKVEEKLKALYDQVASTIDSMPGLSTSSTDLRNYEKEYFGFIFFTSVFQGEFLDALYKMKAKGMVKLSFDEISHASIKIPVLINDLREITDRNNNEMAFAEIEDPDGNVVSIPIFASFYKFLKQELESGKVHLMNLYRNSEDQIMFGTSRFIKNGAVIERMVKRLDNV